MTRYIFVFFFSVFVASFSSIAQSGKYHSEGVAVKSTHYRSVADTLMSAGFIDTASGGLGCNINSYPVDLTYPFDSGYVSGTNIYGDLEKGQLFHVSYYNLWSVNIDAALVKFMNVSAGPQPGFLQSKIYRINSSGYPDSLLSVSDTINVASIAGEFELLFSFPVSVSSIRDFILSVDFENCLTDSIAVLQTESGCYENSGSAFEKWGDDSWHTIANSWQFETDFAIFPIISNAVPLSVLENAKKNILMYPVPCKEKMNFNLTGDESKISIYNSIGQLILQEETSGRKNISINTSVFPDGFYSAQISYGRYYQINNFLILH